LLAGGGVPRPHIWKTQTHAHATPTTTRIRASRERLRGLRPTRRSAAPCFMKRPASAMERFNAGTQPAHHTMRAHADASVSGPRRMRAYTRPTMMP